MAEGTAPSSRAQPSPSSDRPSPGRMEVSPRTCSIAATEASQCDSGAQRENHRRQKQQELTHSSLELSTDHAPVGGDARQQRPYPSPSLSLTPLDNPLTWW